jgi:hypothetical protein
VGKKLDELGRTPYKDVNSPESQEFLRKLHTDLIKGTEELKRLIEEWKDEDSRNAPN